MQVIYSYVLETNYVSAEAISFWNVVVKYDNDGKKTLLILVILCACCCRSVHFLPRISYYTRVGTLIVATIYLQLIQN